MELSLGLSPCPNDIFMFDALLNERIPLGGIRFKPLIQDVEQLNIHALHAQLDISKLSYHVISKVLPSYQILDSGSALGYNNGPILVTSAAHANRHPDTLSIAIPGEHTTANLLLSIFYPKATNKRAYLFSDIAGSVLQGQEEAGLLIHESRFTYQEKGLIAIQDLGALWEAAEHMPIPLGGIAIRRELPEEISLQVNELIKQSILFAIEHPHIVAPSIKQYAQEQDEDVIRQHIDMFVNDFSLSLGDKGRDAVQHLFRMAHKAGLIPAYDKNALFITRQEM